MIFGKQDRFTVAGRESAVRKVRAAQDRAPDNVR